MIFIKKVSAGVLTQVCDGSVEIGQINLVTAGNAITECSLYNASQNNTGLNPLANIAPDLYVAQYGTPAGWADATTGVTHSSGTNPLTKDLSEASGDLYAIIFTVTGRTTGDITPAIGGITGTTRSTNATFTEVFRASGTTNFTLTPSDGFNGTITSLIIYKLGDATNIVYSAKFATANESKAIEFSDALHLQKGCMVYLAGTSAECWVYIK